MCTYGFRHSLHLSFYLYLVPCTPPSLSRTNRTWSCSVWYDRLSVPVESHNSLPLFFELQPSFLSLLVITPGILGIILACLSFDLALAWPYKFGKSPLPFLVFIISPFLAHICNSGVSWVLIDPALYPQHCYFGFLAYLGCFTAQYVPMHKHQHTWGHPRCSASPRIVTMSSASRYTPSCYATTSQSLSTPYMFMNVHQTRDPYAHWHF